MPLADEERERIYEEETVRFKAREQVAAKPNPYFKFFNSALGIWLLSFVLGGLITWQYGLFTTSREKAVASASALRKAKFDLHVVCDKTVATIGDPKTLTYNRISEAASTFHYTPGTPGERGESFGIIELLNQVATYSSGDLMVDKFRNRSYKLFLESNTTLRDFKGWISTIGEPDPVIWDNLKKEQQNTVHKMLELLKEMSEYAEN